uniref:hypothetical protein n=1 Tax=Polynucleobacter sp. TaxID=2029855 RepID=UPI00404840B0
MTNQKSNTTKPTRYFLVAVDMLISEGITKVLIAKSAEDARRKVESDITCHNFSEWRNVGQEIESSPAITYITELTYQQFIDHENES